MKRTFAALCAVTWLGCGGGVDGVEGEELGASSEQQALGSGTALRRAAPEAGEENEPPVVTPRTQAELARLRLAAVPAPDGSRLLYEVVLMPESGPETEPAPCPTCR